MSARRFSRHSAWIGARVRELRIKRDLDQRVLAHRLGISQAQLSKYERGLDRLGFETMIEIADLLRASLDAFRPPQAMLDEARWDARLGRDALLTALRLAAPRNGGGTVA